jgi:hypothetical protein
VTVWRRISPNLAACTIVARPTTAMVAGSSVKVIWNAKAREWLKPSAARKR